MHNKCELGELVWFNCPNRLWAPVTFCSSCEVLCRDSGGKVTPGCNSIELVPCCT